MKSIQRFDQQNNPHDTHSSLLIESSQFLRRKLQGAAIWLYRANLTQGTVTRFPGKVRGNAAYAHAMRERISGIQTALSEKLIASEQSTNAAFVTMTSPNPLDQPDTLARLSEDYKMLNKHRAKVFRNLRRRGVKSYAYAVEATARGGFHIHAALIFDKQMYIWTDSTGVARWPNDIREMLRDMWGANVDVQAMTSAGAAGYITKELYKYGGAEYPLKRLLDGDDVSKNERQSIITYALAHYSGIRLLGTTRDIKAPEIEDDEQLPDADELDEDRLDEQRNNLPSQPGDLLVTMVFSAREIREILGHRPPPWTGTVDDGTAEHEKLLDIAYRKIGMSE